MKINRVSCQGCGADLQVDGTMRFVTCNYCNASLEIVQGETVTHTKRLENIESKTDEIARTVKVMEVQNRIEFIDQEWEKYRRLVLFRDRQGQLQEPSGESSFSTGVFLILIGVLLTAGAIVNPAPAFLIPAILCFVVAWRVIKRGNAATETYRSQRRRYETVRERLLQRVEAERRG